MSTSIPVQVNRDIRGTTVGTTGTGIFTLWGNIKLLSSKGTTLNPYAIEYSADTTNDNAAYVLDVPAGYNWLDTYQVILNANNSVSAITVTGLKGVFFGKFPLHNRGERHQFTPRDAANEPGAVSALSGAATRWTAAFGAPGLPGSGIWLPLDNPVSGTTEHTFPTAVTLFQDLGAATATYPNIGGLTGTAANAIQSHAVAARTSVFVGGASRVMFLPTQVATLSANCEGVLVGRFVM